MLLSVWDDEFFVYLCRRVDPEESDLLSYVSSIKASNIPYTDEMGSNMLHIASSHGRLRTCQRLLECIPPGKTDFHKWNPLHRSLFHGQLSTALLFLQEEEALLTKTDTEGYTPLDLLALDIKEPLKPTDPSLLFSWGTNTNYNLGLGSKESKLSPEIHEFYRKEGVSPFKVQILPYHSGVLSSKGVLYLAGYGSVGRLGNGKDCPPSLVPKSVFPEQEVLDFALGRDHSIFLIKSNLKNLIYATGSNAHRQLGCAKGGEDSIYSPRAIAKTFPENIIGVGACDRYSSCWSLTTLYAWGHNVGQMGSQRDENDPCVDNPRLIFTLTHDLTIRTVYTSDCSMLILTQSSKLILLRNADNKRLHLPTIKGITKAQMIEEYCPKAQKCIKPLIIYILSDEGSLYSWSPDTGVIKCFPYIEERAIQVKDFFVSQDMIFIVSSDTHFLYESSMDAYQSAFLKKAKRESQRIIKLKRIPKANKVKSVISDERGLNFFISVACSNSSEETSKPSRQPMVQDKLCVEEHASLKDGSILVKSKRFDVHIALLQRESPLLAKKVMESPNHIYSLEELSEENDAEELFGKMINLVYEDSYPELNNNKRFRRLAKTCGFFGGTTKKKGKAFTNRSCKALPDAHLISSDGVEFPIHRIVLCQKSEYFSAMFRFGAWSESQKDASIKLQIDSHILKAIIDFLYSNAIPRQLVEDAEDISNLILLAHQFFIPRLASLCEDLLRESIHIRNALKVFQFAVDFSLPRVSEAAMRFICLNMGYFYESGRLSVLEDTYLNELSAHYRNEYFSEERQISRNLRCYLDEPFDEYFEQLILDTKASSLSLEKEKKNKRGKKKSPRKKDKVEIDTKEVLEFSLEVEEEEEEQKQQLEDKKCDEETVVDNIFLEDPEGDHEQKKMGRWTRKSQRERKNEAKRPSEIVPPSKSSTWSGWKVNNDLDEEEEIFTVLSPTKDYANEPKMSRVSKASWRSLSLTDDEESPTKSCPWIQSPVSTTNNTTTNSEVSFENILQDEKKKAVATGRIKRKSLRITQIEDKAIEDLMMFYGADLLSDETIYIERSIDTTQLDLAPVWLKQK